MVSDDTFEESFCDQCDVAKELKNQSNQHEKQTNIDTKIGTQHDESNAKLKNLHKESIGLHTVTKSDNLRLQTK